MDNVSEIQKILNEIDALGLNDLETQMIKATVKSAYLTGVLQGMKDALKIHDDVYKQIGGKRG